ncbi:CmpA/NrtA family ABC transporter substrate-binding protein [Enterovirga aerilata]|uniref:ABC transporter substrate-binding protein n=1 Tax=Enterovirga aerilata TaxID=2730920 RepID=A0A849IDC2_9HYPH|nr:CmpA/NrtA family ABC transporter substrate-binding protein [Enterovirga sp. DB1703]NNM74040.1 ABC transporter substrate-binding protein [Enterovirga sp. DB1703]
MTELRIGFIPLSDAAVLIAAAELGFAEREGLSIQLEKEASWATMRDKLAFGVIDAAHLLAPLAIASSLGLGPTPSARLTVPFALHLNGNAITLSMRLWEELAQPEDADPAAIAGALAEVVKRRSRAGAAPLTLATVFPYSTHTFLLRHFLQPAGIDLDRDIRLTVVPPPYTAEALKIGAIDGFCVGSPWNNVAVASGTGRIVAIGPELVPDAPDKVIAWPEGRLDEVAAGRLIRALKLSGEWCASPANHPELASLLAEPRHIGVEAAILMNTLRGRLPVRLGGPVKATEAYLRFGGEVHRPSMEQARWTYREMVAAGQIADAPETERAALAVYRPDLFDRAVAEDRWSPG